MISKVSSLKISDSLSFGSWATSGTKKSLNFLDLCLTSESHLDTRTCGFQNFYLRAKA